MADAEESAEKWRNRDKIAAAVVDPGLPETGRSGSESDFHSGAPHNKTV
jgi:hypothetical protein